MRGSGGDLCDSEQPYTEERTWEGDTERTGLQEFVDYVLENHNARVEPEKRVYRGTVDVPTFKTTDNVTKGTNFERTLDLFQEKIVNVFGGEWRVRRGDDGRIHLDYRDMLGTVRKTPMRVGHNMESASREPDPERLVTRLYPRGAKLKRTERDEDGTEREVETEERLSIAEVNGGKPYIDDEKAMADFGIIEGHADWDDVTDPLNLMTKAEAWLEDNNAFPVSTEVSALDLSLIGIDPDSFALYDWYPCYNDLIGLDEKLEIVKQTIDVNDPTASSFVLGESTQTQSNKIAALEGLAGEVEIVKSQSHTTVINLENSVRYTMSAIQVAEDRIVSTVGEQIVQTTERIDGEITVIESRVSTIEQTATQIILDVSVLEQSQREMNAQLALMPDQIISTVTEGYEAYVDGEIRDGQHRDLRGRPEGRQHREHGPGSTGSLRNLRHTRRDGREDGLCGELQAVQGGDDLGQVLVREQRREPDHERQRHGRKTHRQPLHEHGGRVERRGRPVLRVLRHLLVYLGLRVEVADQAAPGQHHAQGEQGRRVEPAFGRERRHQHLVEPLLMGEHLLVHDEVRRAHVHERQDRRVHHQLLVDLQQPDDPFVQRAHAL